MAAKANAIEIDELNNVMAKPTPSPEAAEMAIWRHFGEILANREVVFIDVPFHFLEPQTFLSAAMNLIRAHSCHFHYAR
jgi:hypothetical protein